MKARMLVVGSSPNPKFDQSKPVSEDNQPCVDLPIGHEIEHPSIWVHCCPDYQKVIRMEPADDECLERVAKYNAWARPTLEARAAKLAAEGKTEETMDEDTL